MAARLAGWMDGWMSLGLIMITNIILRLVNMGPQYRQLLRPEDFEPPVLGFRDRRGLSFTGANKPAPHHASTIQEI